MENLSINNTNDDLIDLPPGFRFHPTDEELITHYLSPKSLDSSFATVAIGDVNLNEVEPWDLPWTAKLGEKEWYFFFVRDRKYPTGLRTNRATSAGYWKATGKDKDIFRSKTLIGMKKTLVFYRGRAPRGEKTNWVMHEYRLEGENSMQNSSKNSRKEWVICRVFKKSSGGEKVHISGLVRSRDCNKEDQTSSDLPQLTEFTSEKEKKKASFKAEGSSYMSHVTCFSNQKEEELHQEEFSSKNPRDLSQFPFMLPRVSSDSCPIFTSQNVVLGFAEEPTGAGLDPYKVQDQSLLRLLLSEKNNNGQSSVKQNQHDHVITYSNNDLVIFKSWEDQVNLDCLWNY